MRFHPPASIALWVAATLLSSSLVAAFAPSSTKRLHHHVSAAASSSLLFHRHASLIRSKKDIRFFASTGTGSSNEESGGSSESAILLDKVAVLRAAAAKAREEATRLSQELGKTSTITAVPSKTSEEVRAMIPALLTQDVAAQAAAWKELKDTRSVHAFGSANLVTFAVSLKMLEQRTGMTFNSLGLNDEMTNVNLDDFKYATLYVALGSGAFGVASLAFLPPNIGATLCYLFALVPILFLGIGSTAPAVIANAIAAFKNKDTDTDASGVEMVSDKERRCRHEAAHFCCGYWCGLPVTDYSVDDGLARVEFGVPRSKYNSMDVAALTVTAVAGLVGESLQYGKAAGGSATQDLLQLQSVYQKAAEYINSEKQQDLTRWGVLTAATLLRSNSDKYEQIVQAFGRGASLDECMFTLEGFDTSAN